TIDERLDNRFSRGGPNECSDYIRQRQRKLEPTHRCRIVFWYDGKRCQTYAYRLIYARHYGSIAAGVDVAHICEKNGNCGNSDHLIALPRGVHKKFDASQTAWVKAIKQLCPTATGHYGTVSQGWTTNRKSRKSRRRRARPKKA